MENSSVEENNTVDWIAKEEGFSRPVSELIAIIVPLFIVPFVLSGNSAVLCAISKFKSLHKVAYYLLGNLAIADITTAITLLIRCIFNLLNRLDINHCMTNQFFATVATGSSLSGTLIVCLHSFFAVRFPEQFRSGFTVKVAALLVIGSWSGWSFVSVIGLFTNNKEFQSAENCNVFSGNFNYTYATFVCILVQLHLLLLVFFQVSTVYLIKRKEASLRAQAGQGNPSTAVSLNKLKKMSSVVGIVTVILIFTLIAYVPISTAALLYMYCDSCEITQQHMALMSVFIIPNMISNVIIYFLKSGEFNKLLPKVCKRHQVNPA